MVSVIVIHSFLLLMLGIGVYHSRRISINGYVAEKNKLSVFRLICTFVATSVGGGVIVGMVTMGFEAGTVGYIVGLSYMIGFWILALVAPRIRKSLIESDGTLLGFIREKYGQFTAKLSGVVFSLVLFLFLAAQFVAFSAFLEYFFNIDFKVGIFLSAAYLILYTSLGGFRSVVVTDVVQLLFIGISSVIMAYPVFQNGMIATITTLPKTMLNGLGYGYVFLIGALLFLWPSLLARVDIWQRIGAAKSNRDARIALITSGCILAIFFGLFTTLGMISKVLFPNISSSIATYQLVTSLMPQFGVSICLIGILATVMSSADSILNALGISILQTVYSLKKDWINTIDTNRQRNILLKLRIITIVVGAIGILIAFVFPNIVDLNIGGISTLLVFLPALLAGILKPQINQRAGIVSILFGVIVVGLIFPFTPKTAFLPGFLTSLIIFSFISIINKKKKLKQ